MTTNETSIFTKIINREIPADIVYEDQTVIAFLDIHPVNAGHTLVVPKTPFINIFDGNNEILGHMMKISQKIGVAQKEAGLAQGVNLIMSNGKEAGQEVSHAHLHVVPRIEGDGDQYKTTHKIYKNNEAKEIAQRLSGHIK